MSLRQMPAAGADYECCQSIAELVAPAVGRDKAESSAHGVDEVGLAVDNVGPRGRAGILEVGHEHAGPGVQRVDHHLPVDRTGDLDAPVLQVMWRRTDGPFPTPDLFGLCRKRQ